MKNGAPPGDGERYRAGDLVSSAAGLQYGLRQSRLSGAAALLTLEQASLLDSCRAFRTLTEHAAAYAGRATPNARPAVEARLRSELDALARRGLLTSEANLRERCLRAARPDVATPSISTVAVITRDRIDPLRRCLESYVAEGQRVGRRLDYLVVDGARDAGMRDQTRAMLRAIVREHAVTVRYAGFEETEQFADALTRAGISRPEIDFALFDPEGGDATYGAGRNAVLLATLGRLILCADDDTVCQVAAVPGSTTDGLALSSQNDPTSIWFFADQAAALAGAPAVDRDLFGIHERLLGREVARCLEIGGTANLLRVDDTDGAMVRAIESGRARVPVTATGMHGDAGSGLPPAIRLLDQASRARLTETDNAYRTLALSRHVRRGVTVPTISSSPYLMTLGAAFDNRTLLPPFFPVLRGEDTIYGFTLGVCLEGACIGHLPFTVRHSPAESRHVASDAITQFADHPTWFDLVIACVQSYSPSPGASPEERMRGLGRYVGEIASLAPADFYEFLLLWVWRTKALSMARLTADLGEFEATSTSWGQDVRRYLERLRGSLAERSYLMPPELANRVPADAYKEIQRLIVRFGHLLESWPAMVDAARSLAANGQDLAPPLQAP